MTLLQAYQKLSVQLNNNGIEEADFKALCLACDAAGVPNSAFRMHRQDEVDEVLIAHYGRRICGGEPLQYILGRWDFYESEFAVGSGVLIPRPETEELVELALQTLDGDSSPVIADLCAGTGCIGISLAKKLPEATVFCVEKSKAAFTYLVKNVQGVPNVHALLADIADVPLMPKVDVIIANPPYIKTAELPKLQREVQREPSMALDGGADGLDFYRIINDVWASRLNDDGWLLLEIGEDQAETIKDVLSRFTEVEVLDDMYGNPRMVRAKAKKI